MPGSTPDTDALTIELVNFYDEFAEFYYHCIFLCDAITSLAAEEDALAPDTSMGVRCYCSWLKSQAHGLKREFQKIRESTLSTNVTSDEDI